MNKYELHLGDCLEIMKEIPDKSVDMILCDLPYGTTACKWDIVIPFDELWNQYRRIIRLNKAIVLFGDEPFSSHLRLSNLSWYKYDWYWRKSCPAGFTNAKLKPMKDIENISVFSEGATANGSLRNMPYNPQGLEDCNIDWKRPRIYMDDDTTCPKCNGSRQIVKINKEPKPELPKALVEHMRRAWWDFFNKENV